MAETDDFDPPDEDLYRSYSTWELEQLRVATLNTQQEGRSPSGEERRLPAGYYETRIALIDRLLKERRGW